MKGLMRFLYLVLALASVLRCESGGGNPVANPEISTATIHGIVAVRGEPISGVEISLTGRGISRRAASGPDGTFTFADLLPGTYALTVILPGLACESTATEVEAGETATASIACAEQFRGLRVNVHQNDWPDLQWVFVLFVTGPVNRTHYGILGTLASFGFGDLPPGDYAVAVGMASESLYCQSAVATVQASQGTAVDIHCTFQPTGTTSIRGQVTINGAGRALVPVELRDPSGTSLLGLTSTVSFDENGNSGSGNYQFRNLAPGDYAVIAKMPAGAPCDAIQKDATVREGQEMILNFECASQTTGSIAGFVDSENWTDPQLAGRSVTVSGPVSRGTFTGPWNGVYAFDDLPPGDYVVTSWCGVSVSVGVQAGQTAPATMLCI